MAGTAVLIAVDLTSLRFLQTGGLRLDLGVLNTTLIPNGYRQCSIINLKFNYHSVLVNYICNHDFRFVGI